MNDDYSGPIEGKPCYFCGVPGDMARCVILEARAQALLFPLEECRHGRLAMTHEFVCRECAEIEVLRLRALIAELETKRPRP